MLRLWLALQHARKQRQGQVAVFLLLIVVAVIIFAMVTANMGQVSAQALTIANATDASTLYLGSQLATASNQLCKQLSQKNANNPRVECDAGTRGREFCVRTGFLGTFLAVLVIVTTLFVPPLATAAPWVIGLMAAGANAIGNAIVYRSGTAAALGAIQGLGMGLGIAGGVPIPGTDVVLGLAWTMPLLGGGASYTHARADHAIREGLEQVSRGLSGQLQDQRTAEVHTAAHAQLISGLPEYERMRELTLLHALSQLVDDPNRTVGAGGTGCFFPASYGPAVGDPFDADGDGDTTESVSCLDYWWSTRINTLHTALRSATAAQEDLVTRFIEGPWNGRFEGTLKDRRDKTRRLQRFLERTEVECDCAAGGPIPNEGPTVQLWRRLHGAGYSFPAIFQPGPNQADLRAFLDDPCQPACPNPPAGWDSIDGVHKVYDSFLQWANAIVYYPGYHAPLGYASKEAWYRHLAEHPETWLKELYDPESNDDFYDALAFVRGEIDGWFVTARDDVVRDRLPVCKLAYGDHPEVTTSPQTTPPLCPHTFFDVDPETGEPSPFDTDPIYDCTSQVNTRTVTGVHLPNDDFSPISGASPGPICKIDSDRRTALQTEITTVRTRVNALPASIQNNLATLLSVPSLCPEGTLVGGSPQITNIAVALEGTPTVLKYSFDYAYQCAGISRSCSTSGSNSTCQSGGCPTCSACTTTPPASDCTLASTGTPATSRNCSNCSFQCGTPQAPQTCPGQTGSCSYARTDTFACSSSGSNQAQEPIVAPDLQIPSPLMARSAFLDVLNQMDAKLDGLGRLDNDRRIFGTTDADFDNEFAEGVGGEVFVNHAEPLGRDEQGNQVGLAALEYFLQQAQSFANQFEAAQAARTVQPATDGRLPNPAQRFFDPISGTTREVRGEYRWQDSSGAHTVNVEIGPFVRPTTKTEKRGNWLIGKKCIVLVDYCENTPGCPYRGPDRAWVRVSRQDPTGQRTGFWSWNPFSGTIRRTAHSYYDRTAAGGQPAVGLCGTGDNDCG